jgi:electron-transferring-flavoprotein dehydrogenase
MRQAFQYGFFRGAALAGLMTITRGLFPGWRFGGHLDSETPMRPGGQEYVKPDNKYIFDKLSSVFASGNRSRDNQPDHIRLNREVSEAVGETWINMCPAEVYEWKTDENGQRIIQTNPTNCVQCGAIGAKGGRLTPPEGGSGPEYEET